jgi:hypothetical protein
VHPQHKESGHTTVNTIDSGTRMAARLVEALARLDLDLGGRQVLTEAATGAYAVTPVMAAVAGAAVVALAKPTKHGSVDDARRNVMALAAELNVAGRIRIVESLTHAEIGAADIVTNCGHLRPLDAAFIEQMRPGSAIPLMYEAWELRSGDVDLDACRRRGICVAGTNERHPDVGVFDYLGPVVVKAAFEAGHELVHERCLLICDNDFGAYLERSLSATGAEVCRVRNVHEAAPAAWDIVVIAATPPQAGGSLVRLEAVAAALYCQLWGDVDRASARGRWLPEREPPPGHMGLTLQSLGPAPIIRLQAAGLKVGQILSQQSQEPNNARANDWATLVDYRLK